MDFCSRKKSSRKRGKKNCAEKFTLDSNKVMKWRSTLTLGVYVYINAYLYLFVLVNKYVLEFTAWKIGGRFTVRRLYVQKNKDENRSQFI
jgi:hypothetical protein